MGDSFSALSTGASSMSSGHLASAGQQFESALLDSNCRCVLWPHFTLPLRLGECCMEEGSCKHQGVTCLMCGACLVLHPRFV